jgi:predicted nucleic acid-binding protein
VAALPVLSLDHQIAELAAQVRRDLSRILLAIGMGDNLVAGVAPANRLPLFTRNLKHLERVSNLRLIGVEKGRD